jgi:hypothetical protein
MQTGDRNMNAHILSDHEQFILQEYLDEDRKLEGFTQLLSRFERVEAKLRADLVMLQRAAEKEEKT